MKRRIIELTYGILFGISCLIPGFSGGTMLVVLGIYERVTSNIASITKTPISSIRNLLLFILGTIIGITLASFLVVKAFYYYPIITSSFFVGLVIGTIPLILKNLCNKKIAILDILFYIIFLIFGLYLTLCSQSINNIDVLNINIGNGIYILISFIIASAVMIIPAASGMSILLIMGLYDDFMILLEDIVKGILVFDFTPILENYIFLIIVIIGIVIGIIGISKIISYVIKKRPSVIWSSVLSLLVVSVISLYNDVFTNRLNAINNISISSNIILGLISLIFSTILIYTLNKKINK